MERSGAKSQACLASFESSGLENTKFQAHGTREARRLVLAKDPMRRVRHGVPLAS